jgi:electron transfer flavoprotein beta subunit
VQRPLIVSALSFAVPRAEVDPLTGAVAIEDRFDALPAAEEAALEHSLRLAEKLCGTVLAVTVGGSAKEDGLRSALAAGADKALRVEPTGTPQAEPAGFVGNSAATAAMLAAALRSTGHTPDLVLCGDSSAVTATGSFPAFLAAECNAAQALGVVRLDIIDGFLIAHRRIDRGRREVLRLGWPAVVSVEAAGTRLRRADLPAVLAAQDREIQVVTAAPANTATTTVVEVRAHRPRPRELPPPTGSTPRLRVLDLTGALERRSSSTVVGPLSPAQAADELLAYLDQHGFLAARTK